MSAAQVLAQHRKLWTDGCASCSGCDWRGFGNIVRTDLAHAAHQLDALKAAGYEVVQLSPAEDTNGDVSDWWGGDIWCTPGSGRLRIHVQDSRFSADEARGFVSDVLSAAVVAEGRS